MSEKPMSERMPEYLFSSIHQALGAASMAWIPVPSTEVFDSTRAADIALELCRDVADWHEKELRALRESHAELLAAATDIVRRPVGPFGRDDSTAEERLEYALNRLSAAIEKAEAING